MGKKSMSGRKLTFLLITIPIVALFFCFNTLPLIKGVIYSFTNFKGYGSYDWVGLRNYKDLFTDSRVGGSYLFTFKLAIVATIVTNVLSLILALGLNSKIRFKSALRGAYFIPNVLGALVVASIGIVAKKPEQFGKAMLFPAMVETYAILALLISILAVSGIQV